MFGRSLHQASLSFDGSIVEPEKYRVGEGKYTFSAWRLAGGTGTLLLLLAGIYLGRAKHRPMTAQYGTTSSYSSVGFTLRRAKKVL